MYQLAATLVLRSMIDFALTNSRSSRYKHAARHLMECSSLASAIDDFGEYEAHDAYEARLGREHGRNIRGDAVGEFLQIDGQASAMSWARADGLSQAMLQTG